MHIINRKFHAALDYLSGTLLLAAPWIMHFDASAPATTVSVFVGVVILMMSTMTNYEGGLAYHIPMFIHLNIDVLLGHFSRGVTLVAGI